MSLDDVPSQEEVMGWNPRSLADYMKKLKLSGCDKVVVRGGISGAQFMRMTESDLQVFSTLCIPIIAKIQSEIKRGEQRSDSRHEPRPQTSPNPAEERDEEVWDFEQDLDLFLQEEEGNVCAGPEPQTAERRDSDGPCGENSKLPVAAAEVPRSDSGDRSHDPSSADKTSKVPRPRLPRQSTSPQTPLKAPAVSQPDLHVDRSKKPGNRGPSPKDLQKPRGSAAKAPGSSTTKRHQPGNPEPRHNRPSKLPPPTPADSASLGAAQGLDASWYGGKVSRRRAEVALREMNKDGAFVVRDSSKGSSQHPYTLMLLRRGKVYNIKIQSQGASYSLGTSVDNTKSFPGVKEMIAYHAQTPLLLIDAADRSSGAQSQCRLLHPAGL